MSRCFPFPPPGYVYNRPNVDNALIESIKIEKEKEKIKQEKKERKRREKELRKKEKKEKKETEKLRAVQNTDGALKRKRDCDDFANVVMKNGLVGYTEDCVQKKVEHEVEQLENSSLTEEYGQPIVSESLYYSSDGTQSKTKKSRSEQSLSNVSCTTQGKVIRFKLMRREPDNALSTDNQPSTSGRIGDPHVKQIDPLPLKNTESICPRPNEQVIFSETSAKEAECSLQKSSSLVKKTSRPMSAYESLFSEWLPPSIRFDAMEVNSDNELWLLPRKKQVTQDIAILKLSEDLSGRQNASPWPCAHLMPEVDINVLPYTVLF